MKENTNLTPCPTCEKLISKFAANCPDCGHSFPKNNGGVNMSDPVHFAGVIIAILAAIGVVVMMTNAG